MKLFEIVQKTTRGKFHSANVADGFRTVIDGMMDTDYKDADIDSFIVGESDLLTTLQGCPTTVNHFTIKDCSILSSLEYSPMIIKDSFSTRKCPLLLSAEGIGRKYIKECSTIQLGNSFETHLLGLMLIKNLKFVGLNESGTPNNLAMTIQVVSNNLGGDMLDCQEDLISHKLKEYAKL